MESYYLIDFENVHNDGITNIENMTKSDHVHIFSTQNATNIRQDIFWLNGDIKSHLVPVRKQSLDMHLVSFLGYLLGIHGKDCSYWIISKDKDYDNIVKFWKGEGYPNIYRKEKLPRKTTPTTKTANKATVTTKGKQAQTINSVISKREAQVRSFFGKSFKEKIYNECKEDIIDAIVSGKTKQQINNNLMKIYSDGSIVSHIYQTIQPLIKDLPGKQ